MRKLIALLLPLILSGCYVETDDLERHIATVKDKTKVKIEPYPKFTTMPAFQYDAASLRSPFQRPKSNLMESANTERANCEQPNFSRSKSALEGYGLDALTVSGVFTSAGRKWALIKANDGSLHKATSGDYLGLFFGKITSINNGSVMITEMLPDGAGCWQKKQAKINMASQAGENNNV